ncbi:uncharacterized protein [Elaeis guineensis]|uniref:uncharacterized protein isoform X2 n=1 Tax=Elaeis guineensis var. tenera TaxID=51953 RepID=UPI003C6D8712
MALSVTPGPLLCRFPGNQRTPAAAHSSISFATLLDRRKTISIRCSAASGLGCLQGIKMDQYDIMGSSVSMFWQHSNMCIYCQETIDHFFCRCKRSYESGLVEE